MNFEVTGWFALIPLLFIVLCFYFVLTFFENLHKGDERLAKQSKSAAVLCLVLAFLIPAVLGIIFG